MVQLWFARNRRVPLCDQLATQLMLAIASGDLPAGKQLPTTRALAKRYQLNVNTVSAAYQKLETLGWVDSVHGSGVFVLEARGNPGESELADLDRLVVTFLRAARSAGLSAKALRERVNHWLGHRPERFVFVHPEKPLRLIIRKELQEALKWEVQECDCDSASIAAFAADSILLTMPSKESGVRSLAPPSAEVMPLRVRQVDRLLVQYLPVGTEILIVIASGWPGFLEVAQTMLTAAGCDMDAMVFRNTGDRNWMRGLRKGSVAVCDVLTASSVPPGVPRIVFPLISDESLNSLRICEAFFTE